jgi:Leucine-rich repeat (LRR) protein
MTVILLALLFAVDVDLTSTSVTDADLERVGRMAGITRLDLSQTKITDAGLERLKNLKDLRELRLYYAEHITEDGLAVLRNFPQLELLDLRGARVTSKIFEHISHLKNLRSLDLGFTEIIDDGFDHLLELPRLERLVIGGNRLNGECLSLLRQIRTLRDLDVGGTQRVDSGLWGLALTEANLERIGALTQLRRLSLAAATISDRGVDRPGHPEAERIDLPDLSALAGLANLEFLDLTRQPVSAATLKTIQHLPKLTELRLGLSRNLDDSAAEVLLGMKSLRRVYLTGSRMTPQGLDAIRNLLTQSR